MSQNVVAMSTGGKKTISGLRLHIKNHIIQLRVSKICLTMQLLQYFDHIPHNAGRCTKTTFIQVYHCDLGSKYLTCSQLMQLSRRVTGSCVNECTHAWFSTLCEASSQHFPSDRTCLPWPPLPRLTVNKGGFC